MRTLIIIMAGMAIIGALITFWDMIWGDCYDGIAFKIGMSMMAFSMVMGFALLMAIMIMGATE